MLAQISQVNINIKDGKQVKLKEFMRREGVALIREMFAKYIQLLRVEFSQGLILPTAKDAPVTKATPAAAVSSPAAACPTVKTATAVTVPSNGNVKLPTKKLTMSEEFKCRAGELYQVFTDMNVNAIFCCLLTT